MINLVQFADEDAMDPMYVDRALSQLQERINRTFLDAYGRGQHAFETMGRLCFRLRPWAPSSRFRIHVRASACIFAVSNMRLRQSCAVLIVLGTAALIVGCRDTDTRSEISAALNRTLAGPPLTGSKSVWQDVRSFYMQRDLAPAWVSNTNTARAHEALRVIQRAAAHRLVAERYGETDLAARLASVDQAKQDRDNATDWPAQLADLDARVTASLLALGGLHFQPDIYGYDAAYTRLL